MFEIREGSEAFEFLQRWLKDPSTYKITFAVQDGHEQIVLKRNEAMWTAPIAVTKIGGGS